MKPVVLRSPNLAEGGDVRVVRLYEARGFARGGLAMAAPAREVMLHVTPAEAHQLQKTWGAPAQNGYAFQSGSLRPLLRRADGGTASPTAPDVSLIGYYKPQPTLAGGTPTTTPTIDPSAFRQRTSDPTDYYTYGESGPEHQFFTGNATPGQPDFPHVDTPQGVGPSSAGGGGGNDLAVAGTGLALGAQLASTLGYNNVFTQGAGALGNLASGNYLGAAKDAAKLYKGISAPAATTTAASTAGLGAGLGTASGATALGATAPVASDVALSNLGSMTAGQLFGASGSAAAGAGAGSLGTAGGAGALGTGAIDTGAAAAAEGAGSTTAGMTAGTIGQAAIPFAIVAGMRALMGDEKEHAISGARGKAADAWLKDTGFTMTAKPAGPVNSFGVPVGGSAAPGTADAYEYRGADGKTYTADQFNSMFRAWAKEHGYPSDVYGAARGGALHAAGYDSGASPARHVKGPGTGRSDSIPAQLSDGEYVLTAEDVSLLGDGSNEAGAKRLDQFRTQLRKHKGGALAQGKISPNAKAPMQYLKGTS